MSDPIFGIGVKDINPSALQSKFIKALADHQIELSEVALAQLFNGVRQKANEAIPSASLPFPLTSTVKGALTHAKKISLHPEAGKARH